MRDDLALLEISNRAERTERENKLLMYIPDYFLFSQCCQLGFLPPEIYENVRAKDVFSSRELALIIFFGSWTDAKKNVTVSHPMAVGLLGGRVGRARCE